MDGRANNGCKPGENRGQGRKPRAEEQEIIDRLSPLEPIAFEALKNGILQGDQRYVKMFYEYIWGKPKQRIDLTSDGNSITPPDYSQLSVDELILLKQLESKALPDRGGTLPS